MNTPASPASFEDLCGLPYAGEGPGGVDCYDLTSRAVFRAVGYTMPATPQALLALTDEEFPFAAVQPHQLLRPGDVVELKGGDELQDTHLGVMLDQSRMLHARRRHRSAIVPYSAVAGASLVVRVWRWKGAL